MRFQHTHITEVKVSLLFFNLDCHPALIVILVFSKVHMINVVGRSESTPYSLRSNPKPVERFTTGGTGTKKAPRRKNKK
jgi:hypothetical protein